MSMRSPMLSRNELLWYYLHSKIFRNLKFDLFVRRIGLPFSGKLRLSGQFLLLRVEVSESSNFM